MTQRTSSNLASNTLQALGPAKPHRARESLAHLAGQGSQGFSETEAYGPGTTIDTMWGPLDS